jgi:DNA-binding MarR family transcriptional regulator
MDSPDRRRLPILLRHAWYGLNQAFRRRIAHLKITPDQFTVMRTLLENEEGGLMQRELTKKMASDPNTIASLVERMEKAGLIERRTHERDRRANLLLMLPKGKERYLQAREIALSLQAEILSGFSPEEREIFLQNLASLADSCQAASDRS